MIPLRQSTASQEIPLGFFLDSTDGNTEETALTIANTDIKLWKAGATTLANKNSGGATHISNGLYYAVLDATDTDTVGSLVIFCHVSGALAVRLECQVYEEEVYDDLFAASAVGYLKPVVAGRDLDVTTSNSIQSVEEVTDVSNVEGAVIVGSFQEQLGLNHLHNGTAQAGAAGTITLHSSASSVDDFYNNALIVITGGTGTYQARLITDYVGSTKVATITPNWATNPNATSTYAIRAQGEFVANAAGVRAAVGLASANLDTQLSGINTAVNTDLPADIAIIDSNVDAIKAKTDNLPASPAAVGSAMTLAANAITAGSFENSSIQESAIDAGVFAEIAYQVWQEPKASHTTADTFGDYLDTEVSGVGGGSAPTAGQIADAVWDEAISGHLTAGSTGNALNAAGSAGDPWSTALPGAYGAGTAGKIIGDNINATVGSRATQTSVDTIDDFLDTEIAAILADTNELQTDWVNGGRLDLLIDAIKAKTDNLPASPAAVGSAMTLATGAVSANALAADAVDEILDEVVESTITVRQVFRLVLAMMNKTTRSGSTLYFRDVADTKNRVAITIDSNADRTAVTRDLT